MATRRNTRGASRQARSETGSVGVPESEAVAATPRRSTRNRGSTPLPTIGLRPSTAYGTNNALASSSVTGVQGTEQISNVLHGVLEPIRPASISARSTPAPEALQNGAGRPRNRIGGPSPFNDRSYHQESGLFGDAGIESSFDDMNELDAISEESVSKINSDIHAQLMNEKMERIDFQDRTQRSPAEEEVNNTARFRRFREMCGRFADEVINSSRSDGKFWFTLAMVTACFMFIVLLLGPAPASDIDGAQTSRPIRFYGKTDFSHNIGQFIPEVVAHPLKYFNDNEIKSLRKRLSTVEYDVQHLQHQSELDARAINHLQEILPSHVICKRDKKGALQITSEFWHALEDKLRSETDVFKSQVSRASEKTSKSSASTKDVERIVEKKAGTLWDKFLVSNQAKIKSWAGDEFDSKFTSKLSNALKENNIVTKSEFVDLIRQNWADTQSEIKYEVGKLTKGLDHATDQISKLQRSAGADVLQPMVTKILKKLIPAAQLEALSKANLNLNMNYGLTRVNHFSLGTGAIVNVGVTSPSFGFPRRAMPFWKTAIRWLYMGSTITHREPVEALTRWDEHGDCWCAASGGLRGFGASIGVLTGHKIIPDEFVIEHIPSTASLQPGATPREIDLLAKIMDIDTYNAVRAMSNEIFQDERGELEHPYPYVKIAEGVYDSETGGPIQVFPTQVELKRFGDKAHSDAFIVRAKNNWGGEKVSYTCFYRIRLHGAIVKDNMA